MKRVTVNVLGETKRLPITILHHQAAGKSHSMVQNAYSATAKAAREWKAPKRLPVVDVGTVVHLVRAKANHNVELANKLLALLRATD